MQLKEKLIKTYKHELADIEQHLINALNQIKAALTIANKTAFCCQTSLEDLENECLRQLAQVNNHQKKGFLESDIK